MSTPHVRQPVQSNELVFGDYHARKRALHGAIATMANNILVNRMMGTLVEAAEPEAVYTPPTAGGVRPPTETITRMLPPQAATAMYYEHHNVVGAPEPGSLEAREEALKEQMRRQRQLEFEDLRRKLAGESPF